MVINAMKRVDTVGTMAIVFISMEHVWQDAVPVLREKFVKCVRTRGNHSFRWSCVDVGWDKHIFKKYYHHVVLQAYCKIWAFLLVLDISGYHLINLVLSNLQVRMIQFFKLKKK